MRFKYPVGKVDWANLPKELLTTIAKHLTFLEDVISFSVVCKSWQLAVALEKPSLPPKFPVLMLIQIKDKQGGGNEDKENMQIQKSFTLISRGLFVSLEKEKRTSTSESCTLRFESHVCRLNFIKAAYKRCLGSKFGWLLTLSVDSQISLLHPFSRHQLQLPPNPNFDDLVDPHHPAFSGLFDPNMTRNPEDFSDTFIRKAVLSSNPWKNSTCNDYEVSDFVIMAIFSEACILAIARPGDRVWTKVQVPSHYYYDTIYHKDKFYAVDCKGALVVFEFVCDQSPRGTVIAPGPQGMIDSFRKYLVESSGDLLLVSRARTKCVRRTKYDVRIEEPPYWTYRFKIFKLEECTQVGSEYKYNWIELNNLGSKALFVGTSSVSLNASDCRGSCQANCIYFTDDFQYGHGHDMGVFNVGNGTVEHHFLNKPSTYSSVPFWYL